jgi:hypothetical protein
MSELEPDIPVRKSITVKTSVSHAFDVFTAGFHTWWPKTHHIGKSPMKKAILEGKVGGRCYTEQEDGSECDWGSIAVWEPPNRLVIAWQINAQWQFEPDPAKSSEVEIRFAPAPGGMTRVDLEHRYLNRLGAGGTIMRTAVDGPGGWGSVLQLFADEAERVTEGV